ncbi:MAG: hypothetical protein WA956_00350 [Stenotrophomonas sp.]
MRKLLVAIAACLVAQQAHALDEYTASRLVRNYSEAVACQIEDSSYKAFEIQQGDPESNGLGAIYVVHWQGDIGCSGGNGTVTDNFSVVEHRGFMSADPVVVTDYGFPQLPLAAVTDISAENGRLRITGVSYGPNDQQHRPTKKAIYRIKFDGDSFVMD